MALPNKMPTAPVVSIMIHLDKDETLTQQKFDSAALTKCNNKMGSVKGVLVIEDSYWVKVPKLQENKTANKKKNSE